MRYCPECEEELDDFYEYCPNCDYYVGKISSDNSNSFNIPNLGNNQNYTKNDAACIVFMLFLTVLTMIVIQA